MREREEQRESERERYRQTDRQRPCEIFLNLIPVFLDMRGVVTQREELQDNTVFIP